MGSDLRLGIVSPAIRVRFRFLVLDSSTFLSSLKLRRFRRRCSRRPSLSHVVDVLVRITYPSSRATPSSLAPCALFAFGL